MSDETAPEATPDTPETLESTPPDVDWRKRYEDLQPEYTKNRQILTDKEQLLRYIEEQYPDMVHEDEPDPDFQDDEDYDDEPAKPDPRLDQIDQMQAWMAEQQYEKDLARFVGERELTDKGRKAIERWSRADGHSPESLKNAVEEWYSLADEFVPAEPKKKGKTPTPPPTGGKAATGVPDYSEMDENQAVEAMVARARALDSQT